jgi:hypothetical protein
MSERQRPIVAGMEVAPAAFPVAAEPVSTPTWMEAATPVVVPVRFPRSDAHPDGKVGAGARGLESAAQPPTARAGMACEPEAGRGSGRSVPPAATATADARQRRPASVVPPPSDHASTDAPPGSGTASAAPCPIGSGITDARGNTDATGLARTDGAPPPPPSAGSIRPEPFTSAGTPGDVAATTHGDSIRPSPADRRDGTALADAIAELVRARRALLAEAEQSLLELAVCIAEALVERELRDDPELHRTLVRAALAPLEDQRPTAVRASRDAFGAIVDAFGAPAVDVDGVVVSILLDPSLDGMGVVVDGAGMRVDGRVGERLRAVARALEDERRRTVDEEAA